MMKPELKIRKHARFKSAIAAMLLTYGTCFFRPMMTNAGVPPASTRPGDAVKGLRVTLELPVSQRRLRAGETASTQLTLKNIGSHPLIIHQDWACDPNNGWSTADPLHLIIFVDNRDGKPVGGLFSSSFNVARYGRSAEAFSRLDPGDELRKPFPITFGSAWPPGLYGVEVTAQMTAALYQDRLSAEQEAAAWTGRVASNRVGVEWADDSVPSSERPLP